MSKKYFLPVFFYPNLQIAKFNQMLNIGKKRFLISKGFYFNIVSNLVCLLVSCHELRLGNYVEFKKNCNLQIIIIQNMKDICWKTFPD